MKDGSQLFTIWSAYIKHAQGVASALLVPVRHGPVRRALGLPQCGFVMEFGAKRFILKPDCKGFWE